MEQIAEILTILSRFAAPPERQHAARELARWLGIEDVLIFVADPDIDVLIPAPGFRATLPGGLLWQTFLSQVVRDGTHRGEVPFPREDRLVRCVARAFGPTAVIVFIGGDPDAAACDCILTILPLLVAAFQAEQKVVNADATTTLARNAPAAPTYGSSMRAVRGIFSSMRKSIARDRAAARASSPRISFSRTSCAPRNASGKPSRTTATVTAAIVA